jgi:hypothetical protein
MNRLRDNPADFAGDLVTAADRLGLAPLFVEKDYWVTQVCALSMNAIPAGSCSREGPAFPRGMG